MSMDELAGKGPLSQRCPACGVIEAAGDYCTACLARTVAADWGSDTRFGGHRKGTSRPSGAPEGSVGVSRPVHATGGGI